MQRMKELRPVWAEINLDNLAHNIREVKRVVKDGTLITAVIKADGYGHGSVQIAETLLENGADRLAVATLSEAIQLKKNYKDIPVLILGYTPNESASLVIEHNIIQTIYTYDQAVAFSNKAVELDKEVKVHIKVDTGMSRLGMKPDEETVEIIKNINKLPNLSIEGIFTHFAVADETDKEFTYNQSKKFEILCSELQKADIEIPIKHVSNSAATIDLPDLNYNMVRAGIMLYGLYPSNEVDHERVKLKEVMSLRARVSHVKEVEEGTGISYGLKYKTDKKSKIATLPIGYADGYTRLLSGKANAIVKGEIVPIAGRICMDQCMIDVTGLDVMTGDEVILFGTDGKNSITIDEVADSIDTINYEIVCMISKRVPRVYVKDGNVVNICDYIMKL
ncbi:alanine racemase [Wukongibacter baidiensis]|uniref:alanine racemase n=1 Tax=Wukongibacter baidiensis TaxID=1723361 RepID=UPI003D7F2BBD